MAARLGTALLGLALALALGVQASPASAGSPHQEYTAAAVSATNKVRSNHDLAVLQPDPCLRRAAARQANLMAGRTTIFHQLLGPLLDGCLLTLVGENVAYGYPTGAKVVRQGWMKSPGHRANILKKGYRRMGIAARRSDDGTWYVAQVFGRR